jgi:O-acetyl-ADP-ribose deacetylase (regulator of RNase III)
VKPKIFLASSTPALKKMHAIADWLKDWGADALPWDKKGLFRPGDFILERLLAISQEVDGALILFGDEDREWYHADAQPQPRDNVLIEYGIFASQLGRQRVVVCRTGSPRNASDLGGLIFLQLGGKTRESAARDRLRDWMRQLPELMEERRNADREKQEKAAAPVVSGIDAVYRLPGKPSCQVRIQTGALKDIVNVDVIVSSENTDLQPARFYDRAMSGTLRYLDAEKNKASLRVRRDAYFEALSEAIKTQDVELPVVPGAVLVAPTSGLSAQGVKFVFHAAVVEGKVGAGYEAIETAIEDAIRHSFERFAELAARQPIRSMLFPMFGAGQGRLGEDTAARRMIRAIETLSHLAPQLEAISLLAHVESHRIAFRRAAEESRWVMV